MHRAASYSTEWLNGISRVDRAAWNALALPLDTPFLEWDWLNALEGSGSITALTGWEPRHLVVHADGRLVGAAALYIKTHSAGEFVFDHPWVDVAERIGVPVLSKARRDVPGHPGAGLPLPAGAGHGRTSGHAGSWSTPFSGSAKPTGCPGAVSCSWTPTGGR